jgi:hypothetical protein
MSINNYVVESRVRLAFLEDNISFRDEVIESLGDRLLESRFRNEIIDPFGDIKSSICDQTAHPIGRLGVMQAVAREIERVSEGEWSVAKPDDISRYFSEYTDGSFDKENSCGSDFLQTDSLFVVPNNLRRGVFKNRMEKEIYNAIGYNLCCPFLIQEINAVPNEGEFKFVGNPLVTEYTKFGEVFIPKNVGRDGKYIPFTYRGPGQYSNDQVKRIVCGVREKKFYLNDDIWSNGYGKIPLISS